ncbi:hypothetical protein HDA40_007060 [Hamadaea flava]|uniref:Uncharacterized protein n=1 Tax=Hamadaea flava TaxID=1742688 RepID=A0ABV8M108_9ACTN|nr:hypothetical protein [Hamadaea flava]MCP2328553.1 hypothetical protein [Hamadaea flava]
MIKRLWAARVGSVMAVATLAVAFAAVPAQALEVTFSTTGASGRAIYIANGAWTLRATDTLTDGHCARFQRRLIGSSTWEWTGESSCSGTDEWVGSGFNGYDYRICRTGVLNCSAAKSL